MDKTWQHQVSLAVVARVKNKLRASALFFEVTMDYCIFYIFSAVFALILNKQMSFMLLMFGALIDKTSSLWFNHFVTLEQMKDSPNIFYAVPFLVYAEWFIFFDAINLKRSAIAVGVLTLYTGVMFLDATASPEDETIFYTSYPVIISLLNALIIIAGYYDNRRISFASISRMLSNYKKNHGADL